jgi:LPXTG-site transpeptidase (sortase) family protein
VEHELAVGHEVDELADHEHGLSRRRLFGLGAAAAGVAVAGATVPALPAFAATKKKAPAPRIQPLGILQIDKLHVAMTMVEGITTPALNAGPAHYPGTPLPGFAGNAVFAGHRVSHHRVFRNIDQLVPGDKVLFYVSVFNINTTFTYEVTSAEIVDPRRDAGRVLAQSLAKTATLFACHPPHSTRQRYVVHTRMVETPAI